MQELPDHLEGGIPAEGGALGEEGATELEQLRVENAQMRIAVVDLEKQVDELLGGDGQSWTERIKEYEGLLEEKSEVIRSLHRKIQDLHDRPGAGSGNGAAPREQELLALSEELERERRQLKEDEDSLMQQMREMEVQMSRERAELARQRNEIVRLQSEIRHELELASRDSALRERLAPFQRRHAELTNRRGSGPPPPEEAGAPPQPQAPAAAPPPPPPRARKESGIFGRLFGQGE